MAGTRGECIRRFGAGLRDLRLRRNVPVLLSSCALSLSLGMNVTVLSLCFDLCCVAVNIVISLVPCTRP